MKYGISTLDLTFTLVFIFIIFLIFFFYYYGTRKRIMVVPSGTSVWSFWRLQATPAVRKEFVAKRIHALRASLSEIRKEGSCHAMKLHMENASDEELLVFLSVTPSMGCQASLEYETILIGGRGNTDVLFDVKVLSGKQSITVHITSEGGESLFSQTHSFAFSQNGATARDYLGVLGLSEGASKKEILKRRRQLAKEYHPDKDAAEKDREKMLERMKEINRAYTALKEMGYV